MKQTNRNQTKNNHHTVCQNNKRVEKSKDHTNFTNTGKKLNKFTNHFISTMNDEPKETTVVMPDSNCINIATISAGFEKGDFLVREEQGNRVYFDFFEEVSIHVVS